MAATAPRPATRSASAEASGWDRKAAAEFTAVDPGQCRGGRLSIGCPHVVLSPRSARKADAALYQLSDRDGVRRRRRCRRLCARTRPRGLGDDGLSLCPHPLLHTHLLVLRLPHTKDKVRDRKK